MAKRNSKKKRLEGMMKSKLSVIEQFSTNERHEPSILKRPL